MRQRLNQHLRALHQVFKRIRHQHLATLMMAFVMGVTLCLPGVLYVIVDNLNRLANNIQGEPQISLFLKLDVAPPAIAEIRQRLKQHPGIKSFQFNSRESAWQQLKREDDGSEVLGSMEQNPLPDAFLVQPHSLNPENVENLQKEMQQWPEVELAQVDASWIKRLHSWLELSRKAILVLALLLSFTLIAIIGNTIRLQILTQREEIEVSRLIGATNAFIRRPFYIQGCCTACWAD